MVVLVPIVVHVTQVGDRATALLADLAVRLHRGTLTPDEHGCVRILFDDVDTSAEAWDAVHEALEAVGGDWHDHLHMNALPHS